MTPLTAPGLPELLYLHDPLCGWCYSLSPAVAELQVAFTGRLDVSVLCGGMVVSDDADPIAETWEYLRQSLGEMETVTGVRFGEAFRALGEAGTYRYDSEPPSRAIVAFRQLMQEPTRTVAFAHAVQQALFRDGHDLSEAATYAPLIAPFGVDYADFLVRWVAPETARAAQQEFAAVARIGVQGFPTLVVRIGEQGYVLARGYQPYEQLRTGLEQLLRDEV